MKKFLLFPVLCFLLITTRAQQVEDFSLVRENAFVLNPAVAGMEGTIHALATFRKQFLKVDQSPYTALFAADGQIISKHIGIGGYLIHDVTGPTGKTGGTIACAYNIPLQGKYGKRYSNGDVDHVLSIGISLSVVQYRLDASQLSLNDPNDPGLYKSSGYKIFPDASVGVYYKWKDNLFAGVSVPQMMGLDIDYRASDGTAEIKKVQHVNVLVGGKIQFARGNFSIDPVADFRWAKGGVPQGDVGLRFIVYKVFWVGANYRSLNYAVFESGLNIKDIFTAAYAYDFNFSKYRKDIGATHELSLIFNLNKRGRVWRGVGAAPRF